MNATCDICGEPVSFGSPTDTTYRAFFHISTARAACPTKDPNPMIHIISATSSYVDDTKTETTQHAMCGALLGPYRDAVSAGHPTGNYMAPTLEAALSKGVSCPGCLKRFAPTSTPVHNGPAQDPATFLATVRDEDTVTPEGNRVTLERSGDVIRVVQGNRYVATVRHRRGSRRWSVDAPIISASPASFRTGKAAWAYAWSYVDALI